MKTKERIEYIKATAKFPFSWSEFVSKYIIIICPILLLIISTSMFYGGYKFGHVSLNNFANPFFFTALSIFVGGVLFIILIITRIEDERKFEEMLLPGNLQFENIPGKIKHWELLLKTDDELVFGSKMSFFSWGELITIIKISENRILVNSRADKQPFAFGRKKKNLENLLEVLNCV
jgi:hypothetical protein